MKNKFRDILYVISIFVLLSSLSYLVYNEYTKYNEKKMMEEVRLEKERNQEKEESEVVVEPETEEIKETEPEEEQKEKTILPEYEELYEENNDLYGWLKIEGTEVDYPVMHTPQEPNFYIHKNFDKEDSKKGSIYVDGRCGEDTENLIIYGHNMKDRSMFGSLREYKQKEYYENHKYIEFDTIYEKQRYEIISVSKAIIYYDENVPQDEYLFYEHVELDSKEEFDDYMRYMKNNTYYCINNNAEYGDKIITLCTCDYWTENARLLIVAKKIK